MGRVPLCLMLVTVLHGCSVRKVDSTGRSQDKPRLVNSLDWSVLKEMKKALLTLAGVAALLLGIVGIALPGLPTTPFVLLAAYCFAQTSPRLHRWLRQNRVFGGMIRDWESHHSLTRKTKLFASAVMMAMVLISLWQLARQPLLQLAIFLLGLIGSAVVWKIPTRTNR